MMADAGADLIELEIGCELLSIVGKCDGAIAVVGEQIFQARRPGAIMRRMVLGETRSAVAASATVIKGAIGGPVRVEFVSTE
jgi:hypothetical protein